MEVDKVKAIFSTDEDGYITGYQQEFWDGTQWQTPFDDEKAIMIAPEELKKIAIGASKLADQCALLYSWGIDLTPYVPVMITPDQYKQITGSNYVASKS